MRQRRAGARWLLSPQHGRGRGRLCRLAPCSVGGALLQRDPERIFHSTDLRGGQAAARHDHVAERSFLGIGRRVAGSRGAPRRPKRREHRARRLRDAVASALRRGGAAGQLSMQQQCTGGVVTGARGEEGKLSRLISGGERHGEHASAHRRRAGAAHGGRERSARAQRRLDDRDRRPSHERCCDPGVGLRRVQNGRVELHPAANQAPGGEAHAS
eukprot:6415439-Prymnesium_polylepis.1